jgi:hypothetical protein
MSAWTADELARIGRSDELQVSSRRANWSLRPYVTIWAVRLGDDLYVRSAHGPDNGWFRRAKGSGQGRIRTTEVERDVGSRTPCHPSMRTCTGPTTPSTIATARAWSQPCCLLRPREPRSAWCPGRSTRAKRDTITTRVSLALSRSCHYAHEVRTSQAECRGFESRLPLHF